MKIEAMKTIEGRFKSLKSFQKKYPGWHILSIDNITVIGCCESCSEYILEGSQYFHWADGIMTCASCGGPESIKIDGEENEYTRRLKAGEPI